MTDAVCSRKSGLFDDCAEQQPCMKRGKNRDRLSQCAGVRCPLGRSGGWIEAVGDVLETFWRAQTCRTRHQPVRVEELGVSGAIWNAGLCSRPRLASLPSWPRTLYTPTLEGSLAGNLMTGTPVKIRNFTTKQRIFIRKKSWEKSIRLFPFRISFFSFF